MKGPRRAMRCGPGTRVSAEERCGCSTIPPPGLDCRRCGRFRSPAARSPCEAGRPELLHVAGADGPRSRRGRTPNTASANCRICANTTCDAAPLRPIGAGRRAVALASGGNRPGMGELAVLVDVHPLGRDVDLGDQARSGSAPGRDGQDGEDEREDTHDESPFLSPLAALNAFVPTKFRHILRKCATIRSHFRERTISSVPVRSWSRTN